MESTFILFAKGLVLGVTIAAPVGPIGVLCIRRTLQHGFAAGVAGGLGTALADALYALLAAFGFAAVLSGWIEGNDWVRLAGAVMLLFLAWQAWNTAPDPQAAAVDSKTLGGTFAATFALTIANPATILTFLAVFAAFEIDRADPGGAAWLVGGVFLGSLGWWIVLAGAVSALRARIDTRIARAINRVAALVLAVFAFLIAGQVI
ncbi:MAG: LysE family translocator [Tagaea sp.]|nr:LysE family translocator [Tagaea sp.]